MTWKRRIAPVLLAGIGLILLGERWVSERANRPPPAPAVAGIAPLAGTACLQRDSVLTALTARGIHARPEVPTFCHGPADLPQWFAFDPIGPDGTHLAFDAAGCLTVWAPAPCPAP